MTAPEIRHVGDWKETTCVACGFLVAYRGRVPERPVCPSHAEQRSVFASTSTIVGPTLADKSRPMMLLIADAVWYPGGSLLLVECSARLRKSAWQPGWLPKRDLLRLDATWETDAVRLGAREAAAWCAEVQQWVDEWSRGGLRLEATERES